MINEVERDVAIKEIEISNKTNEYAIQQEIENMFKVKQCSEYAVELYDVIMSNKKLFLVMEYINGEDMIHVKFKNDDELVPILKQLILGLDCFHKLEMVHGDVKPQNVMLTADRKTAKWIDFGFMCSVATCRTRGTPNYIDPKILTNHIDNVDWFASDIWSFGCLVYTVASGKTVPFQKEFYEAFTNRNKGIYKQLPVFNIDDLQLRPAFATASHIMRVCLQEDVMKRRQDWDELVKQIETGELKIVKPPRRKNIVDTIYEALRDKPKLVKDEKDVNSPAVWISGWVPDPKAGILYRMSNGDVGVLFWDNTSFFHNAELNETQYKNVKTAKQTLADMKKGYFMNKLQNLDQIPVYAPIGPIGLSNNVQVMRQIHKDNATIFRLSDKTFQIFGADKTGAIISDVDEQTKDFTVTYFSPDQLSPPERLSQIPELTPPLILLRDELEKFINQGEA
jgi:serine/threonine protein kinase